MDLGFGPNERLGIGVVSIDVLPELLDRGEGFLAEGLLLPDREEDLHLIEPTRPGAA
jgi:hypothetical protein